MTSSYTNIQVLSRDLEELNQAVDHCEIGTCKILGRPDSQWIGVYSFMCEGDYSILRDYTQRLSAHIHKPVFGFMVESGELLKFILCDDGELIDEYCSNPGYPAETKSATGGNTTALLKVAAVSAEKAEFKQILHAKQSQAHEAVRKTAGDRMLQSLAPLFGMPRSQVCTGYNYLKRAGVGKTSDLSNQ